MTSASKRLTHAAPSLHRRYTGTIEAQRTHVSDDTTEGDRGGGPPEPTYPIEDDRDGPTGRRRRSNGGGNGAAARLHAALANVDGQQVVVPLAVGSVAAVCFVLVAVAYRRRNVKKTRHRFRKLRAPVLPSPRGRGPDTSSPPRRNQQGSDWTPPPPQGRSHSHGGATTATAPAGYPLSAKVSQCLPTPPLRSPPIATHTNPPPCPLLE